MNDQLDDDDRAVGALLREHATKYTPPPALAQRIQAQIALEGRETARASGRPSTWTKLRRAFALYGAGFATAALVALVVVPTLQSSSSVDRLAEEVATNHVRSMLASNHLSDVASSDHHTVKPWFSGKLDYAPPVVDLAADGYPLVGGRVDVLEGRSVAALIYRRGQHTINLFVWPMGSGQADTTPALLTRKGYTIVHWVQDGMQAWAVSDASGDEVRGFAAAFLRSDGKR